MAVQGCFHVSDHVDEARADLRFQPLLVDLERRPAAVEGEHAGTVARNERNTDREDVRLPRISMLRAPTAREVSRSATA